MLLLKLFWPFIKEMILGDKTVAQAVKTHKLRVALIALIFGSFALNIYVIPKTVEISSKYLELEKNHKKLLAEGVVVEPFKNKIQELEALIASLRSGGEKDKATIAEKNKRIDELITELDLALARIHQLTNDKPGSGSRYEYVKNQLEKLRAEELQ